MLKKIKNSIKFVKLYDIVSIFIFFFILPISLIFRIANIIRGKKIWLICEDGYTARDNGYHLFKYIRENHPEEKCYYVIDKKEKEAYERVKQYGNIIQFRSLKHWLYYMSAYWNISIQKKGNPNQVLFYILHVYLNLYNNRVFLQHGITKDLSEWLFYKNTKFKYFICGAKREYEYIKENFGYPEENVKYIGFARFDNLYNNEIQKNKILVIPTWRNWLRETNSLSKDYDFKETEFYIRWLELLNSKEFIDFIEQRNLEVYFYPHIHMMKFLNDFEFKSKNITKLSLKTDLQKTMKEAALMITDYSSVYMDFAYMEKPIIYYQFDIKQYREGHLQEGYFNYNLDGFGPVCEDYSSVIEYLNKIFVKNEFIAEEKYLKKMKDFFELKDQSNCKRHYDLLKSERRK